MINKSAKFMIDSINDCYSDLSDDQRTTANRVLKLCHEAVSNGVVRDKNTFNGVPLPPGYVYKFDELLKEANKLYEKINIK